MNAASAVIIAVLAVLTAHTAINALFWLRRPPTQPSTVDFPVAVLLPLRDEAHRVAPCLRALLAQRGVPQLSIVVLDDGSIDGTADVVTSVAAGDPRVRLLAGAPLPAGWLGKPYACHQLAAQADPAAPVLAFVDADVVLAPDAIAASVALLHEARAELLSPYPRILGGGTGQRLVQPLLQWSWLTFLPLRAMERSARPSLAAAGGQFMVLSREGYQRAGGHAGVRDRVLEDIELARALKRAGGRIALADGSRIASCRMYNSWKELSDGYTKSLWASFGSPLGAIAVVLLLALLYVVPPIAALFGSWAGVAGYAFGVAGRMVSAKATGGRAGPDALGHPISIILFGYLIARSFWFKHRHQLFWKGREVSP
jgi:glycosyltransferase involved in cell wall biosynthesis